MDPKLKRKLIKDGIIIAISLVAAYFLVRSSFLDSVISSSNGFYALDSFIAGLFFTSIFTTAPAIALFAKLGSTYNPFMVAAIGALGSVIGDLIIFRFLKDHLTVDIEAMLAKSSSGKLAHLFQYRFFRWSLAFFGALIIASPFPDEVGLALMGLSHMSPKRLAVISYIFNAFGILVICFIARSAIQ